MAKQAKQGKTAAQKQEEEKARLAKLKLAKEAQAAFAKARIERKLAARGGVSRRTAQATGALVPVARVLTKAELILGRIAAREAAQKRHN